MGGAGASWGGCASPNLHKWQTPRKARTLPIASLVSHRARAPHGQVRPQQGEARGGVLALQRAARLAGVPSLNAPCTPPPQDREAHLLDYPALTHPHIFVLQACAGGERGWGGRGTNGSPAWLAGGRAHPPPLTHAHVAGRPGRVQGAVACAPRAVRASGVHPHGAPIPHRRSSGEHKGCGSRARSCYLQRATVTHRCTLPAASAAEPCPGEARVGAHDAHFQSQAAAAARAVQAAQVDGGGGRQRATRGGPSAAAEQLCGAHVAVTTSGSRGGGRGVATVQVQRESTTCAQDSWRSVASCSSGGKGPCRACCISTPRVHFTRCGTPRPTCCALRQAPAQREERGGSGAMASSLVTFSRRNRKARVGMRARRGGMPCVPSGRQGPGVPRHCVQRPTRRATLARRRRTTTRSAVAQQRRYPPPALCLHTAPLPRC